MVHIIYLSSAVAPFSPAELLALLEKSRKNNTALGLTGLLLYKDGSFLQVLEGEQAVVEQLYARIGRDPRHQRIIQLFKEPITQRQFGNWSMAFRDLDYNPDQFPEGYSELLNANWSKTDFSQFSGRLRAFMKMFAA